jgi:hypothetical protein
MLRGSTTCTIAENIFFLMEIKELIKKLNFDSEKIYFRILKFDENWFELSLDQIRKSNLDQIRSRANL